MAVTNSPRLGLTRWSSGMDPFTRAQMEQSHAALDDLTAIDGQGTMSQRPPAGVRGRFYTDTATGLLYRDDGTKWVIIKPGSLDDVPAPTKNYSMGGQRITDVADPVGLQDVATKSYVDEARTVTFVRQVGTSVVDRNNWPSASTNFFQIPTDGVYRVDGKLSINGSVRFQVTMSGVSLLDQHSNTSMQSDVAYTTGPFNGYAGWILKVEGSYVPDPYFLFTATRIS